MAYGSEVAKICKAVNGFELELYKPSKKDGKSMYPDNAWKTYVFDDAAQLLKFLKEELPALKPQNADASYEAEFNKAAKED